MGNWYRVVKTIKGHRYAYLQQTYREGEHVRTLNRYIGKEEGNTTTSLFSSPSDFGRAVVEQIDPPKWGEDLRQQLLGGGGRIARRSAGVGGKRKATPFDFGRRVSGDPAGKRRFHARARVRLTALAGELGLMPGDYDLASNMGGEDASGEVTLRSDSLYIKVQQSSPGEASGILYCFCKGRWDKDGGVNHFAPLELLNNPSELARVIRLSYLTGEASVTTTPSQGGGDHERSAPSGYTPRDVQKEITGKIIEAIESGRDAGSFQMPWKAIASEGLPVNAVTGMRYHGANVLFLRLEAMQRGWPNKWASFQQWKEKGASVKKGEHGVPIVFYKSLLVDEVEEDEEGKKYVVTKSIHVFRYSTVFNISQVDNPPEDALSPSPELPDPVKRNEAVEQFVT